jgi:hypothetical protein
LYDGRQPGILALSDREDSSMIETDHQPQTSWPDRFEREYPDKTPDGLAWLEEHLALDRGRMARLAGLEGVLPSNATSSRAAWAIACQAEPDRSEQLEEVLTDLIHHFGYDWPSAAEHLRGSVPTASGLPLPADVPDDAPLLVAVHTRSPGWTRAIADYFSRTRG